MRRHCTHHLKQKRFTTASWDGKNSAHSIAQTVNQLPLTRTKRVSLEDRAQEAPGQGRRRNIAAELLARCATVVATVVTSVVIRGINIHPSSVDAIVRSFPSIAEYRVEVDQRSDLAELRLQIEAAESTATALAQQLRSTFNLRIAVTAVALGSLPTFEVKAQRWQLIA